MSLCKESNFEKLFKELSPRLQRFIQSKGADTLQAADMAQESFLKLWQNCSKVTPERALSYLFTVASNLNIDISRKAKTKLKYLRNQTGKSRVEDPDFILRTEEFKTKLEAAMDEMTEGSRAVFIMSRIDDMKYREIAESLNISVKAVEKRMSKALKHLIDKDIIKPK